ncbi:hypothetical protein J7W19_22855 [Streptomyces mobaraensis NBRC 13819 = DSM 40847]|uniref:DUF2867 domain-containing protein n=1 Tax=Streptomyces mobaraensis (strain ATCC 29032 / DSM 40847 / JCM 4168 / NBRC 13819 / NCIMB 11159 / IPCR 16-22) TaxID=1223523 RepID=M3BF56_STRM1|nr:hypothetical protein [Streptomyces mobaraensis]EME98219.1 hypothetical protein H340_22501 [Streptomyces mobaraensis NBRC 13819 = DSM 40847]QTT75839.1 hypothetical protein J7W19_22855 [Streptomyces mobaraensis NBRC 13819 = DSM 40847]
MTDPVARPRVADRVRHIPVPPAAHALSTLPRIDYENAVLAEPDPAPDRTALRWARAVLEDADAETRQALTQGWTSLGLALAPAGSDGHVLGWRVRGSTPDAVLLAADATRGLRGELLFQRAQGTLLLACFIRLDDDAARALWAQVESHHPQVMHRLLEQAVSRAT